MVTRGRVGLLKKKQEHSIVRLDICVFSVLSCVFVNCSAYLTCWRWQRIETLTFAAWPSCSLFMSTNNIRYLSRFAASSAACNFDVLFADDEIYTVCILLRSLLLLYLARCEKTERHSSLNIHV